MSLRNYCFTLHFDDFDEALALVPRSLPDDIQYLTFNIEQGRETGKIHWQGYVELSKTMRIPQVKQTFINEYGNSKRFEKMNLRVRIGTQEEAIAYATKEDTRIAGPFEFGERARQGKKRGPTFNDVVLEIQKTPNMPMSYWEANYPTVCARNYAQLRDFRLRQLMSKPDDSTFVPFPWQKRILDMVALPADDRHIIWVTDTAGNKGKSRLAHHLQCNHEAILLSGRIQDMAHTFKHNISPICIFDISRAAADHSDHLYSMAEQLKNGSFNSSKYDSSTVFFPHPHVIFFSNSSWDRSKWTNDRVIEIDLSAPEPAPAPPPTPAVDPEELRQMLDTIYEDLPPVDFSRPLDSFW